VASQSIGLIELTSIKGVDANDIVRATNSDLRAIGGNSDSSGLVLGRDLAQNIVATENDDVVDTANNCAVPARSD